MEAFSLLAVSDMWSIGAMPRVSDMGELPETAMVKGGRGVVRMRRLRRCGGYGRRLGLSEASLWVGEAQAWASSVRPL